MLTWRYHGLLNQHQHRHQTPPCAAAPGRPRLPAPDVALPAVRRPLAQPIAVAGHDVLRATTSPRSAMPCRASARTGRGGENRKPWPNRTSQSSRSTTDALALDLLGDQVDAEAAEQIGEIGRMDIGGRGAGAVEQQARRHLDEAEAARRELARLEPQVAADCRARSGSRGRRARPGFRSRSGPALRRTLCVNSSTIDGRDRAVGLEEFQQLLEHRGVGERRSPRDCRTGRSRGSSAAAGAPPARSGTPRDCRSSASGRRSPPVRRNRRPAGCRRRSVRSRDIAS